MTIPMNDSRILTISQIKEFIKISKNIEFKGAKRKEKYEWITDTLNKFGYFKLRKKDKSTVKRYIMTMTGLSDAQITRLIARKKKTGKILENKENRHKFPNKYTSEDISKIIETDKAHNRLSGPATKKVFKRMFDFFKDVDFLRLKDISISHIYNLRDTRQYTSQAKSFTKTRSIQVRIGERRKPSPEGRPGYLRVDTVHQGDLDKEKGVYHINLVDEVTQWEIVIAVEKISERYLLSVLEMALNQFPFKIMGFHSDNGSEYINKVVSGLLSKLLIEQTKSRSRHCNDNALVECKNGAVIRKHMGYIHIPQKYAGLINEFYKDHLNPYLNYHRPCGYATERINAKGKVKKVYDVYQTPYEALRSHSEASEFLKEDVILKKLDKIAYEKNDNEFAALMQKAKVELFKKIDNRKLQLPTNYNSHLGLIA